jgi:hypothetical protein
MRKIAAAAVIVIGCTVNFTPGIAANAATTAQTPSQKACAAFSTWDHSRTAGHLDSMVFYSFAVTDKYLASDIGQLYADTRGGAKAKYITADVKYVSEDCN